MYTYTGCTLRVFRERKCTRSKGMQQTEVGKGGGDTRRDLSWWRKLYRWAGSAAGSDGSAGRTRPMAEVLRGLMGVVASIHGTCTTWVHMCTCTCPLKRENCFFKQFFGCPKSACPKNVSQSDYWFRISKYLKCQKNIPPSLFEQAHVRVCVREWARD